MHGPTDHRHFKEQQFTRSVSLTAGTQFHPSLRPHPTSPGEISWSSTKLCLQKHASDASLDSPAGLPLASFNPERLCDILAQGLSESAEESTSVLRSSPARNPAASAPLIWGSFMTSTAGYEPLLDALSSLYSNSGRAQKEAANAYLESFQKSVRHLTYTRNLAERVQSEAWQTTHDILSSDGVSIEAKLFAAQTIKTKVSDS